jgi:hypothetical protein
MAKKKEEPKKAPPKKYARGRVETPAAKKIKESKRAEQKQEEVLPKPGVVETAIVPSECIPVGKPYSKFAVVVDADGNRTWAEVEDCGKPVPLPQGFSLAEPPVRPAAAKPAKGTKPFHPHKGRMPPATRIVLDQPKEGEWEGALSVAGTVEAKGEAKSLAAMVHGLLATYNKVHGIR